MSKYSASVAKRKTTSVSGVGKSSSGSSSGRVAANSYGNGTKYAGGNTFTNSDGSTTKVTGEYTSPSGKITYVNDDGSGTVLASKNKSQIGQTFYNDGTSTMGKPTVVEPEGSKYSYTYKGEYDNVGKDAYSLQVDALQEAMRDNKKALQDAYDESEQSLNDAIADAQRRAYVNQQKSIKAMPQMMAAAGYSGGVSETTAANIMNEYQNALTDLGRSKAHELARLQANLANGIANTNSQYNIQLADALQAAQAYEAQQAAQAAQLGLQERAMKLSEDKFLAEQDDKDKPKTYNASEIINMVNSGLMSANEGRQLLGLQGGAPQYSGAIDRMIGGYYEGLNERDFENLMAYYIREGRITPNELQAWLINNRR